MNNDIEKWRAEIDVIDGELLSLLNKRARLATEIGRVKQREHAPLCDADRERKVLARVCEASQGPLPVDCIKEIFNTIIDVSRRLQHPVDIAAPIARPKWNRVTIVGCGLIGGSFALALKRSGACRSIAGWDISSEAFQEALHRSIIDEVDTSFADGAVSQSDLIYLAMPVSSIINFMRECGMQVRTGSLVTDAGSTKVEICRAAGEYLRKDVVFVGGHPIAGSEHSGLAYSDGNLFRDAAYAMVHEGEHNDQIGDFEETLRGIGAHVVRMTADTHDHLLTFTSHLPQLLSTTLAATLENEPQKDSLLAVSGKGLRDMTRLAGSSWSMWRDIVRTNQAQITSALDVFTQKVDVLHQALRGLSEGNQNQMKEIEQIFNQAHRLSRTDREGVIRS
jgi:prephenate dehydrogenase/chorismate mutase